MSPERNIPIERPEYIGANLPGDSTTEAPGPVDQKGAKAPANPSLLLAFREIQAGIDALPKLSSTKKDDLKSIVEDIQNEVAEAEGADLEKVARLLHYLKTKSQKVLKSTTAALMDPANGVYAEIQKAAKNASKKA